MKVIVKVSLALCLCVGIVAFTVAQDMGLLGGANTVFDESEEAFTNPLPGLTDAQLEDFEEGDELFEEAFVAENGLGPVFNAVSCESCHIEDGRGRPPAFTGEVETGFLIRLAINETQADGSTLPDPIYGGQFQDVSVSGVPAEGTVRITHTEINGFYADGTPYTLYAPEYSLIDLNYGALDPSTTYSPRIAQQMIGLGLLEAVTETTILSFADPNDANGDGISGRANYVWDAFANRAAIGRFGWKANQPNLLQQGLGAFNGDMGITSTLNPDQPCTIFQMDCMNFNSSVDATTFHAIAYVPTNDEQQRRGCRNNRRNCNDRDGRPPRNGRGNQDGNNDTDTNNTDDAITIIDADMPEVSDEEAELVVFYSSALAVPAQRNPSDPQVLLGETLFTVANCAGCHIPEMQTGEHATIPQLSYQTINPYTDLLLHDMGAGLADNQIDFLASGQEWRTPPLWGIGLLETVNGYAFYMHDGRARSLEEAILWHGGEASASRDAFINMSVTEREAMIAFLKSL